MNLTLTLSEFINIYPPDRREESAIQLRVSCPRAKALNARPSRRSDFSRVAAYILRESECYASYIEKTKKNGKEKEMNPSHTAPHARDTQQPARK